MNAAKRTKTWLVYDGRAASGDTDNAIVYVSCDSLREARSYVRRDFTDGCIFEYDIASGNELINERRVL